MRYVIEVIVTVKEAISVVTNSEIHHTAWFCIGYILSRHMIWHKVDYHPHAGIMRSDKKRLEFLHASIDIDRYVGIYIIVVLYRIRRTRLTLYYMFVVAGYAVTRIIGLHRMLYNSRIPYMSYPEVLYLSKDLGSYVIHFSRAVLLNRTVRHAVLIPVGKQPRQHLVNYRFSIVHINLSFKH